jgi:hypothetical protein
MGIADRCGEAFLSELARAYRGVNPLATKKVVAAGTLPSQR